MKKIKKWENPKIWTLSVEKTEKKGNKNKNGHWHNGHWHNAPHNGVSCEKWCKHS